MPFNIAGVLVPLHLIVNPRLIIPSIIVKDIRQLDFPELRKAGYRGAVFDKDNCLTVPHDDRLVPELQEAWRICRETFGEGNVLIVSNTAGSHQDAGGIGAEAVSYHLSAPVLRHPSLKPSYSCIASIRAYFASLPVPVRDEELIIVGDRLLTDVVLANRMSPPSEKSPIGDLSSSDEKVSEVTKPAGPLAVWTTGMWRRDATVLRWIEQGLLHGVQRWVIPEVPNAEQMRRFVRPLPPIEEPVKEEGMLKKLWSRFRR
ncbi:hypothetical protein CERSUDRAFT_108356 [Gelatoporia subvermispora B]|uniref:HAD phosphatase n=1 Tax=Ceriporiopsis subvermispora (strain B) TaxID=914234 RepID=M2Q8I7_CERS8|nr:hypothetical protein CERSUDRAFT_108356 [Gelatoporia subvermispora B]